MRCRGGFFHRGSFNRSLRCHSGFFHRDSFNRSFRGRRFLCGWRRRWGRRRLKDHAAEFALFGAFDDKLGARGAANHLGAVRQRLRAGRTLCRVVIHSGSAIDAPGHGVHPLSKMGIVHFSHSITLSTVWQHKNVLRHDGEHFCRACLKHTLIVHGQATKKRITLWNNSIEIK